jgi:hypothetical protein
MSALRVIALIVLGLALRPGVAAACASCISSAYGDRTYTWPYLGLIVMPFIVGGVIAVILYRHRGEEEPDPSSMDSLLDKETT